MFVSVSRDIPVSCCHPMCMILFDFAFMFCQWCSAVVTCYIYDYFVHFMLQFVMCQNIFVLCWWLMCTMLWDSVFEVLSLILCSSHWLDPLWFCALIICVFLRGLAMLFCCLIRSKLLIVFLYDVYWISTKFWFVSQIVCHVLLWCVFANCGFICLTCYITFVCSY